MASNRNQKSHFQLSPNPLERDAIRESVRHSSCGGFVAFEGWVRDENLGKSVSRLTYEAYQQLCYKEGRRILEDALERFPLHSLSVVHRTGELELEDVAVVVAVSATHRAEAFEACQFVINQVKSRLPIWKKEHYTDGTSEWVSCQRCAAVTANSTKRANTSPDPMVSEVHPPASSPVP